MGVRVVQDPTVLNAISDPDGTPQSVSLCEYVRAVRIQGSADEIDTSTLCATRTQLGSPRWSIVLAMLWSPEMYAALEPLVGQELEFQMQDAEDVTANKAITWRGSFAFVPFGNFELNSRVESDLPLAVTLSPAYGDAS